MGHIPVPNLPGEKFEIARQLDDANARSALRLKVEGTANGISAKDQSSCYFTL